TWTCSVLILPNCALNLPAFTIRSQGKCRNVMYPSSTSTPELENDRKRSARAYGSTIAWNEISDSSSWNDFVGTTGLCPAVARKLPMTAIAGLKKVGLTGFGENTFERGAGVGS